MAGICSCTGVGGNTGLPSCLAEIKVAQAIYFVYTKADDGTLNVIDATDTIDDAFIEAKINHVDPTKRFYPLDIDNVAPTRAEPTIYTSGAGVKFKIKDGIKTFAFDLTAGGATLLAELEAFNCKQLSYFIVDEDGKLIGLDLDEDATELTPIKIQKGTMLTGYKDANYTDKELLSVSFDWSKEQKDYQLSYIVPDTTLAGRNGLVSVKPVFSNISQTGLRVSFVMAYGDKAAKGKVTDLVTADFFSAVGGTASRIYNKTDSAAVTVTVTESSSGVYDLVFSSQTVGDELRVLPQQNGYDFSACLTTFATVV